MYLDGELLVSISVLHLPHEDKPESVITFLNNLFQETI